MSLKVDKIANILYCKPSKSADKWGSYGDCQVQIVGIFLKSIFLITVHLKQLKRSKFELRNTFNLILHAVNGKILWLAINKETQKHNIQGVPIKINKFVGVTECWMKVSMLKKLCKSADSWK